MDGVNTIVGSPFADPSGSTEEGKAYIYTRTGAILNEAEILSSPHGNSGDHFGSKVSIAGNYAIVGAPDAVVNGMTGRGYVDVFQYDGSSWTFVQALTASDGSAGDHFGGAVDINGDYIIVGAPDATVSGVDQGKAYVFHFDGQSWNEITILSDDFGAAGDKFGYSVSTDGFNYVIGAPWATVNGTTNQGKILIGPLHTN